MTNKWNRKPFTTQKIITMSNTDATKNCGWPQVFAKGKQSLPLLRHPHVTHIVKTCLATAICSSEREVWHSQNTRHTFTSRLKVELCIWFVSYNHLFICCNSSIWIVYFVKLTYHRNIPVSSFCILSWPFQELPCFGYLDKVCLLKYK
jgi:hypothetical protein